jgi:hypothetical protein
MGSCREINEATGERKIGNTKMFGSCKKNSSRAKNIAVSEEAEKNFRA